MRHRRAGVRLLGVKLPIAGQPGALDFLLFEEHVERGYDGVGPLTKLLGEVPLADNDGSFRELTAHTLAVHCDLIGKSAEFLFLLLCRAFLSRGTGFENASARRGDANEMRARKHPRRRTMCRIAWRRFAMGICAERISGGGYSQEDYRWTTRSLRRSVSV